MADQPVAISDVSDPGQIRVKLLASGREVHAPLAAVAGSVIHGAPTKATPVDADEFGFWDSVGLQAVKTTWANIKATIWTALGALINGGTGKTTPVDADMFAIADSAASNATKKLTWANLKAGILAYFNGTAKATPVDADRVWQGDSTTSFTPVYSTWTQVKAFLKTYLDTLYQAISTTGTFTPVIVGTTIAGAGTYTNQLGSWTRIGDRIFFEIDITWTAHTGTGNLTVTALPVAAAAGAAFSVYWDTLTYTSTPMAIVGAGGTTIILRQSANNTPFTAIAMDAAARLIISGCYRV